MKRDALRAAQEPLKQQYRDDPATGGDGLSLCSGDMLLEELDTLLRLTERYCVVLQTITRSPSIEIERSLV
jgi:hypothetical protein